MIIADYDSMIVIRIIALQNNQEITVFGHTLKPVCVLKESIFYCLWIKKAIS